MIIYKITRKKYVDNAFKKGGIRIGTIFYYKQFEDEAIGDTLEGLQPYLLSPEENNPRVHYLFFRDRINKIFKKPLTNSRVYFLIRSNRRDGYLNIPIDRQSCGVKIGGKLKDDHNIYPYFVL